MIKHILFEGVLICLGLCAAYIALRLLVELVYALHSQRRWPKAAPRPRRR